MIDLIMKIRQFRLKGFKIAVILLITYLLFKADIRKSGHLFQRKSILQHRHGTSRILQGYTDIKSPFAGRSDRRRGDRNDRGPRGERRERTERPERKEGGN